MMELYYIIGHEAGADLGPMISPAALKRAEDLIEKGVQQGAKVVQPDSYDYLYS